MADVEVAVWFGGEAGVDGNTVVGPAGSEVLVNQLVDEVLARGRAVRFRHVCHSLVKLVRSGVFSTL